MFKVFRNITKIAPEHIKEEKRTEDMKILFSFRKDTKRLMEITDIQDELNIVKSVLTTQRDVLVKLLRLYPENDELTTVKSVLTDQNDFLFKLLRRYTDRDRNTSELHLHVEDEEIHGHLRQHVAVLEEPQGNGMPQHSQGKGKTRETTGNLAHDFNADIPRLGDNVKVDPQRKGGEEPNTSPNEELDQKPTANDDRVKTTSPLSPQVANHSILKCRSLLKENIDIVDTNIRIVTDLLKSAAKVQEEVPVHNELV